MNISTKVFLGFAIILFFSISGFVIQYKLSKDVTRNMGFVSNSEDVIRNSTRLHKSVIERHGALRGYLLTDNKLFLEPYYEGEQIIPSLISEQKKLLKNSAKQLKILDTIQLLHNSWTEYADSMLIRKNQSHTEEGKLKYQEIFEMKMQKGVE